MCMYSAPLTTGPLQNRKNEFPNEFVQSTNNFQSFQHLQKKFGELCWSFLNLGSNFDESIQFNVTKMWNQKSSNTGKTTILVSVVENCRTCRKYIRGLKYVRTFQKSAYSYNLLYKLLHSTFLFPC